MTFSAKPKQMADDIIGWQMQPKNPVPYLPIEKTKDKELISEKVSSQLTEDPSGH